MTEFTDPDGRRYVVVGSTDIAHKSESSLFIRRMTDPLILIQVMKGQGLVVDVDRFRICLERQDEVRVRGTRTEDIWPASGAGFQCTKTTALFTDVNLFTQFLRGSWGRESGISLADLTSDFDPTSIASLTLAVQQLQAVMVTCFGEQWDGCMNELFVQLKSSRISTFAPAFLTEVTEKALSWVFSDLRSTHYLPLVGEPASLLLQRDVVTLFRSRLAVGFVATSDSNKEWWAVFGQKHKKGSTLVAPRGKAKRVKGSMSEPSSLYDSESS